MSIFMKKKCSIEIQTELCWKEHIEKMEFHFETLQKMSKELVKLANVYHHFNGTLQDIQPNVHVLEEKVDRQRTDCEAFVIFQDFTAKVFRKFDQDMDQMNSRFFALAEEKISLEKEITGLKSVADHYKSECGINASFLQSKDEEISSLTHSNSRLRNDVDKLLSEIDRYRYLFYCESEKNAEVLQVLQESESHCLDETRKQLAMENHLKEVEKARNNIEVKHRTILEENGKLKAIVDRKEQPDADHKDPVLNTNFLVEHLNQIEDFEARYRNIMHENSRLKGLLDNQRTTTNQKIPALNTDLLLDHIDQLEDFESNHRRLLAENAKLKILVEGLQSNECRCSVTANIDPKNLGKTLQRIHVAHKELEVRLENAHRGDKEYSNRDLNSVVSNDNILNGHNENKINELQMQICEHKTVQGQLEKSYCDYKEFFQIIKDLSSMVISRDLRIKQNEENITKLQKQVDEYKKVRLLNKPDASPEGGTNESNVIITEAGEDSLPIITEGGDDLKTIVGECTIPTTHFTNADEAGRITDFQQMKDHFSDSCIIATMKTSSDFK